ncbi:Protein CLEC16A, partial [Frankliniella fusca]
TMKQKRSRSSSSEEDSSKSSETSEEMCQKRKKKYKKKNKKRHVTKSTSESSDDPSTTSQKDKEIKIIFGKYRGHFKRKQRFFTTSDEENKKSEKQDKKTTNDFDQLNNATPKLTCADLKLKKPYTLQEIRWSKQAGKNGTYKVCTAKFSYKGKILHVKMPNPIANYDKDQKDILLKKLKAKQNPIFKVLKVTKKKSPTFKGYYDFIESEWC